MEECDIPEEEALATLEKPDAEYPGNYGRIVAEKTLLGCVLATKVVYNLGGRRARGRDRRVRETDEEASVRLEYDPESGALYICVRGGEYEQSLDLAEPGFGAHVDVDSEGNVLGLEFLSFEEYAELVTRHGGALELPERIEDPASFRAIPASSPPGSQN